MAFFDINQIYTRLFGETGEPLPTGGQVPQGTPIRSPLAMAVDGNSINFQFEPIISIFGKNTIIRNHVLKARGVGTVKEYWNADDYRVEIRGVLHGEDPERLPVVEIDILRNILEARKTVEVSSPYLTVFGIQYLAIEDFEFLHTAGYNNQAYIIKAYSDEPFELF